MASYTNNNNSSNEKETKSVSPKYSSTESKSVIPGTQYYFLQKDYANIDSPVYIERYHEDIIINICTNHAGDGVVFRDKAMYEEYNRYKRHLRDIGRTEKEISAINFDSLSLNIDSISAYPGIYTFVYDSDVPEYMRILAPSVEDKPMELSSYSQEVLGSSLSKMSVSYVFYFPNDQVKQKEYSMQSRSNSWEIGDRLIPSGKDLNDLFDLSGRVMNAAHKKDLELDALSESHKKEIDALNKKFAESVQDMENSRASLTATVSDYESKQATLNNQAIAIATAYPYVLQPTKNYTPVELRTQVTKRNEYNEIVGQIQSFTSLIKSSQSSLKAITSQLAEVTKRHQDTINEKIAVFKKESDSISFEINALKETLYIARSFKVSIPLSSRGANFTKLTIYDHYKYVKTSAQLVNEASDVNRVSSYRKKLKKEGSEDKKFYGEGNLLSKQSWKMIYSSEDISANSKYVQYYSIDKTTLTKTLLSRSEYLSEISSVDGTKSGGMSKHFEIALVPPPISYLATGGPLYDFSSIHSTINNRIVKRRIDRNKMFYSPSLAVDFGEETGKESDFSEKIALEQQSGQGTYRCVTNFKLFEEGRDSKYTVSWKDSSSRKIDLKRQYSSSVYKPNISRDAIDNRHKSLEFNAESVSLSTNPFVQDYKFEDGFSIFLLVRQNETDTSAGNSDLSNKFRNINSLYPNDIYKNEYFEINWPSSFSDTNSGKDYKLEYSLNSIFERNKIIYLGKKNTLSLTDTYGIDQSMSHIPTTKLSSASNGYSDVSGFSKANLFTPNAYSIVNIEYSGKGWNWYKNGVLLNTSSAKEDFFQKIRADIMNIGGFLDEKNVREYYKREDSIYRLLLGISKNQNLTDFQIKRLEDETAALKAKRHDVESQEKVDQEKVAELTARIAKNDAEVSDYRASLDKLLKEFKEDLYNVNDRFQGGGFSGEIAEMIIYSGSISKETRVLTEGYLSCKFNLAYLLPNSHLYKSSCPLLENNVVDDPYAEADDSIVSVFRKQNLSDLFVYTTAQASSGEWRPSWFPLRSLSSQNSIYTNNATWDRARNRLTLHRTGAENIVANIDIFDTLNTVLRPTTGIMVPNVSSFVDAIFPYAISATSEQLSLSPAQEGFYKIINFSHRGTPDLLWETNASGDTDFGGNYITSSASPASTSNFAKNVNERKRSSSIYNGIINKVGGGTALQRATKVHYSSGFDSTTNFTPSAASPIKVLTAMEFANGARTMYLDGLIFDAMFTIGKEWSQADHSANVKDFEAVAITLIKEDGKIYNLAFLRPGGGEIDSRYKAIMDAEFSDLSFNSFTNFNSMEQRQVAFPLFDTYDSNLTSRITIDPHEAFSLEFSIYLAKDGAAKLGSVSNRKVNSGFFISNCRFITSDEKTRRNK